MRTLCLQSWENFYLSGAACDVETLSMAYGLCWEPALTQCSIALNYLTGNSADPSAPLPFWDKVLIFDSVAGSYVDFSSTSSHDNVRPDGDRFLHFRIFCSVAQSFLCIPPAPASSPRPPPPRLGPAADKFTIPVHVVQLSMNLWPQDANIGLFLYTWLPFTCLTLPHSPFIVVSIQTVLSYYKSSNLAHNFPIYIC